MDFKIWMESVENKKPNTSNSYAYSIMKIEKHYASNTGENINLNKISDIAKLNEIANDYSLNGRFSQFGDEGNGTIRNAIATYLRYRVTNFDNSIEIEETKEDQEYTKNENSSEINIFTYERDLKESLIRQSEKLFPEYGIYGTNGEGIEYCIKGKRIDLLLEHANNKSLIAIELKAGKADFKVFGQISMYLGLLSEEFIGRDIKGIIIAGDIDDSLKYACITSEKIRMMKYEMQLNLEEVKIKENA